jgi:hypothetical protein
VNVPSDPGSGRPLLDKLGVKPGMRVALVAFSDPSFATALAERGAAVEEPPAPGLDQLFYRVRLPADLVRIAELRSLIHDAGAIWVLCDKGAGRTVREVEIIEAGRAFGLVDNKIASFSPALAAMRLVVPIKLRGSKGAPGDRLVRGDHG